MNFPNFLQLSQKDCGATCLKIISKHYKKDISIRFLREFSETTREGASLSNLANTAEKIGFKTLGVKLNFKILKKDAPLPCIIHWKKSHFVVVYKINKKNVYISDPAIGLIKYSHEEFIKNWIGKNANVDTEEGIALLLEPSVDFLNNSLELDSKSKNNISLILRHFLKYKGLIMQLLIGLLIGSILTLIVPFLTQSIVDIGIQTKNLNFIHLILIAQVMLFLGRISIDILRSWILLHLSTRINISLVSDFFIKLMNLPISFFDSKMTGDIIQRINDHNRIENLLTNTSLNTLFSLVNIILFNSILIYYNIYLFLIFFIGNLLYIGWIFFFLAERKKLDYRRFSYVSDEKSKVIELINGMQDIKLFNAEKAKRWEWEYIQAVLFKLNIKILTLEQKQDVGSNTINQLKDIFITFMSASLVVKGELSLGMMISIQYIIGQSNSPLIQLVNFIQQFQDAKISLERLNEINEIEEEESINKSKITDLNIDEMDLKLDNISFRYPGNSSSIIENLDLIIPKNKITAIVGDSGSGKTTLMKLLMKFYEPTKGVIKIGNTDIKNISHNLWRNNWGVVMQDGYIFNDTIAQNIAIGDESINKIKLEKAVEIANIKSFIEELPLSYNTKIGNEGLGISGGQKQRLMIARAVYKDPNYIFFDEATSSLDANNEQTIMKNLNIFFKGKTVIIIAHRLSTVKNANQIIVMGKGKIIEIGNHQELLNQRGAYYNLVKNQLDLDNLT